MKADLLNYIRKMKQGDEVAFKAIYDLYHKKIAGYCLYHGLQHEDAKEVVQDTFLKLWENKLLLDTNKNFEGYFFKIAKNEIVNRFRKIAKDRAAKLYKIYLLEAENTTENKIHYDDLQLKVKSLIDSLPEVRRIVFHSSRIKGLSNQEIANELGISVRTVETHISKALQTFHAHLDHLRAI